MKCEPEQMYLDLLKKTVSYMLWPEPPISITTFNDNRPAIKRIPVAIASKVLATKNMQIVQNRQVSESARIEGSVVSGYADTMIGIKRLDNLQFCIETVIKDGVEGDLIETGVWRGGRAFLCVEY